MCNPLSMLGISANASTQGGSSNSQRNYNGSSTTTPNIPDWWMDRYNGIGNALNSDGMTADQQTAAGVLRSNLASNVLGGAYGTASDATTRALGGISSGNDSIASGLHYLQANQDIGSNTLGHWFPDAVAATGASSNYAGASGASAAGAPGVTAGTGAQFMGAYETPLNDDYVNASLADYDAGAAKGFNALRAGSADAFGNKRTGVAEGQFMADAARGRGTLSADARLNAFNTAAGLGQSDATRALAADTTNAGNALNNNQFNANLSQSNSQFNAGNLLNNNQFNANLAQANNQYNTSLTDSRQKFDIGQADAGDDRRLGIAGNLINSGATQAGVAAQGAAVGSQGLGNAVNYNAANVSNANALGNFSNMTLQQLLALLNAGQAGIGSTTATSGSDTTNTQTHGSSAGINIGGNANFGGK